MHIDWLTVVAQWVNFLILIWLLQRFLYQPIVQAMDKRQQAIVARGEEAKSKAEQAEMLARDYRDKLAELETRRAELMAAAREAAATERARLVEQARSDAKSQAEQWRRDIEREKAEFQTGLNHGLGNLITATARKAVRDLCSLELEQALFANFLERLQQLPEHEKQKLSESGKANLTLAASFELDEAMRRRLAASLDHALPTETRLTFETLPDSQCGLRLSSSSYSIEWTVAGYFQHLQAELETLLAQRLPTKASSHVE